MKKRVLSLLLALFLLAGTSACSRENGEETGTSAEGSETVPSSAGEHTTDRTLREDWQTVVPAGEHEVRMAFLNVGKADAILIRIDGTFWLIDTGTAITLPMLYAGLHDLGAESLDGIFITHTDNDHVGGLRTILSDVPAKAVYTSVLSADWDKVERLRGDTPRIALDPGEVVPVTDGVWFEVLGPIRYNPRDDNNSLVLRLQVNGTTSLFAGDMMFDEERTLMSAGFDLRCDLLKVGHHGKKDATSQDFAAECGADIAVICASKEEENDSAHKSVVKILEKAGAEVYVTEDYTLGIEVTAAGGRMIVSALEPAGRGKDVSFAAVSKADQLTVLENTGEGDADLSGWWIVSETGNELFRFPDGTVLPAGGTLSVGTNDYNGVPDFRWNEGKVWHKTKADIASLIDRWGNTVDSRPSE